MGLTSWADYPLRSGSNSNAPGEKYLYPLVAAANNGHTDVVELLLAYSAIPRAQGDRNETPLHHIAQGDLIGTLSSFLDRMRSSDDISGRQIDAPGLLGQTLFTSLYKTFIYRWQRGSWRLGLTKAAPIT
ncbi:hypothetical protein BDW68DRAFT_93722 [Aspergillus falconensis]